MMKLFSRWRKNIDYRTQVTLPSAEFPGVVFTIRKMSLGQRIALSSRVRELSLKNEFLRAGEVSEQLEASLADLIAQKLYLEWALIDISGLRLDGRQASAELLVERGPEALVAEISEAIRNQLELSNSERKNC